MKVIARPIDMIVIFSTDGTPTPIKLRYEDMTIQILGVTSRNTEKLAGNQMQVLDCIGNLSGQKQFLQLKLENRTCKWILFKL